MPILWFPYCGTFNRQCPLVLVSNVSFPKFRKLLLCMRITAILQSASSPKLFKNTKTTIGKGLENGTKALNLQYLRPDPTVT